MTSAIDTLKMMFDLDTYKSGIKSMFDDKYGMFGDGGEAEYKEAAEQLKDAGFSGKEILEMLGPPNYGSNEDASYDAMQKMDSAPRYLRSSRPNYGSNEDASYDAMEKKAYGGRIGFESGTRDGRTVGMSQNRTTQLLTLREEAVMKNDEDKIKQIDQELFMMGFRVPNALGGRIGFQRGRSVQPVEIPGPAQEMQKEMQRLMDERGMSRKDAEEEAEINLFGPSAMKLRDSKNGIASMLASADDDEYKSPPFLDDPEGRMSTDELEAIMQIMQEGRLSELEDSDQFMIYDLLLEKDMLPDGIDSFEDFKRMYSGQDSMMASRREGIMQMVG